MLTLENSQVPSRRLAERLAMSLLEIGPFTIDGGAAADRYVSPNIALVIGCVAARAGLDAYGDPDQVLAALEAIALSLTADVPYEMFGGEGTFCEPEPVAAVLAAQHVPEPWRAIVELTQAILQVEYDREAAR